MDSWVGNPVEETTSNGVTLIQHSSLAKSITSSDRQDLMITSMNNLFDMLFQLLCPPHSKSVCNAME